MPSSPSRTCDVASGGKLGREALQLQKDMEKFEQQRLHQAQQQQKQQKAEEKSSLPRAVLQLQVPLPPPCVLLLPPPRVLCLVCV